MTMKWMKAAGIRALKTFAQTALATLGTAATVLGDVNWVAVLSASALAALLSILTSLAGLPEVKEETTKATDDGIADEVTEALNEGDGTCMVESTEEAVNEDGNGDKGD